MTPPPFPPPGPARWQDPAVQPTYQPGPVPGPYPYPEVGPTPAVPTKIKPGKTGIWLGIVLMIAGAVTGIAITGFAAVKFSDQTDKFPVLKVPGTYELTMSRTGKYVIYLEYNPGGTQPDRPTTIAVKVNDAKGEPVIVVPYYHDVTFSVSGHRAGISLFRFHASKGVKYTVETSDRQNTPNRLLVGTSLIDTLKRPLVVSFLVGGGLFILGLLWMIVTLVKRGKAKKAQGPGSLASNVWAPGAPPMPMGVPAPPGAYGPYGQPPPPPQAVPTYSPGPYGQPPPPPSSPYN